MDFKTKLLLISLIIDMQSQWVFPLWNDGFMTAVSADVAWTFHSDHEVRGIRAKRNSWSRRTSRLHAKIESSHPCARRNGCHILRELNPAGTRERSLQCSGWKANIPASFIWESFPGPTPNIFSRDTELRTLRVVAILSHQKMTQIESYQGSRTLSGPKFLTSLCGRWS